MNKLVRFTEAHEGFSINTATYDLWLNPDAVEAIQGSADGKATQLWMVSGQHWVIPDSEAVVMSLLQGKSRANLEAPKEMPKGPAFVRAGLTGPWHIEMDRGPGWYRTACSDVLEVARRAVYHHAGLAEPEEVCEACRSACTGAVLAG